MTSLSTHIYIHASIDVYLDLAHNVPNTRCSRRATFTTCNRLQRCRAIKDVVLPAPRHLLLCFTPKSLPVCGACTHESNHGLSCSHIWIDILHVLATNGVLCIVFRDICSFGCGGDGAWRGIHPRVGHRETIDAGEGSRQNMCAAPLPALHRTQSLMRHHS